MLGIDRLQEILTTLRMHRLRTLLTSLSVAWGIFMLVLLVGAGRGLENGVKGDFRDDAVNSIWLSGGRSSVPYRGLAVNRPTVLRNDDYEYLREHQRGVGQTTSRFSIGNPTVSYGNKTSVFDIRATHPAHQFLELTRVIRGRFLNELDLDRLRKVAVIGVDVSDYLFGDQDPIGEYITIGSQPHRVVGIFEDDGGDDEEQKVYIPVTTAQMTHGGTDRAGRIMFTVRSDTSAERSQEIEEDVRTALAARHGFHPSDRQALRIRNNVKMFSRISSMFAVIEMFVWLVSAGTIIAGIVGVSNIMLISVKERTKEFGIRKALGARPRSIISMVVQEAILVTGIAGYAGLIAGVGALELASALLPATDYFANPGIDLRLALQATCILITAGALAGYIPARRAAKIPPVVALRNG